MDAPTTLGVEQTPSSWLSPGLLSVGQKLCPEGKPPRSFRIVGSLVLPSSFSTLCAWTASVQKGLCGRDPEAAARLVPVPCILRADLMLRTPGLKSPTPIVMASCPYVSVKPLAEIKLGVDFPALRTPRKARCYQGMHHLAGQRSLSQRATPGTT